MGNLNPSELEKALKLIDDARSELFLQFHQGNDQESEEVFQTIKTLTDAANEILVLIMKCDPDFFDRE